MYPLELQLAENSNLQDVRRRKFSQCDTLEHILAVMRRDFSVSAKAEARLWVRTVTGGHDFVTSYTSTVQSCRLYSGQLIIIEVKNFHGWPRGFN